MKKTIILASIAALFAFSSCQKENLQDNVAANGVRIITAEFENTATKTTLNSDGKTPEWEPGDVIRVLNATAYQDVTLESGKTTPTVAGKGIIKDGAIVIAIPDEMTDDLYAIYPASATSMDKCTGSINFTIPAVQDGSFGSANICVAKGDDKDNLVFSNATAVLEFDAGLTGVKSVRVRATNVIAGEITVSFGTDNKIDNDSYVTTDLTTRTITAGSAAYTKSKFYVAVAPVETGAVGFKYYKDIDHVARLDDGSGKNLVRNKIYALTLPTDEDSYTKDYELIGSLKWATQNVCISDSGNKQWNVYGENVVNVPGTIYPVVVGDYFQWGATNLIYDSFINLFFGDEDDVITFIEGKQFNWETAPYKGNDYYVSPYEKYNSTDSKTTLEADDDVACNKFDGDWRMPESSEFAALYAATYWAYDENDYGWYVFAPDDDHSAGTHDPEAPTGLSKCDAMLFFPITGFCEEDMYSLVGDTAFYYSSSLDSNDTGCSCPMYISSTDVVPQDSDCARHFGCSVRPVSPVSD